MKKKFSALLISLLMLALPLLALAQCYVNNRQVPCSEVKKTLGIFAGVGILVLLIIGVIVILAFAFWLWMLIHAITKNIENKNLWVILLIISFLLGLNLIVAVIYYFAVKRPFDRKVVQGIPAQPGAPQQSPPADQNK